MELPARARVLVVVADAALARDTTDGLAPVGELSLARDVASALARLDESDYDVVVSAPVLPDGGAEHIAERLRRLQRASELLVLVRSDQQPPAETRQHPVLRVDRLADAGPWIAQAAALSRLRREHRALRTRATAEEGGGVLLLSGDPAMRAVLEAVDALAAGGGPVLIEGELGTGKEGLARRLHHRGPRAEGPFAVVRCQDAPDSLERRLSSGHGGVVYLEDVECLPGPSQGRLLALLDAAPGPSRAVRLVCSTRRDLATEAREGRFSAELAQRLTRTRLRVPPLRERRADIPLLATHFLSRCTGGRRSFGTAALEALSAYPWPGNVRELRMAVERAALVSSGPLVEPGELRLEVDASAWPLAAVREGLSLEQVQRRYIEAVLAENAGHRGRSAQLLGVDPKTLYNRLGPSRARRRRRG